MKKACYTITEFCLDHGNISRGLFYALQKQGNGPRLMKVGRRILISDEAAADWRKQMEYDSNPSWIDSPVFVDLRGAA